MAEEALRDRYANIATWTVVESSGGTLTFQELLTNAGIDSSRKTARALLIDEIDYSPRVGTIALMTAATDHLSMAITISNAVTDIEDMTDSRILHQASLYRHDMGTAASGGLVKLPMKYQFFPPLITAERRLYAGCVGTGLAALFNLNIRMYYRTVQLTEGEFIELTEVFRLVG